jgi:hypothetical protein
MRTASIHSGARRRYGILGTAIVVGTRGRTPVRVGVFVDVCVGVEDARAVRPLERPGPTRYEKRHSRPFAFHVACLRYISSPVRPQAEPRRPGAPAEPAARERPHQSSDIASAATSIRSLTAARPHLPDLACLHHARNPHLISPCPCPGPPCAAQLRPLQAQRTDRITDRNRHLLATASVLLRPI